jgi:hypothetical protein
MTMNTPAGTADYLYPALIEEREEAAINKADSEATGEISNPIVRDIIPSIDLDVGADASAVTGNEHAVNLGSAAAGDSVEVYEIDSDTGNADDRVIVIYGFEALSNASGASSGSDVGVDKIIFKGSDGQIFERAVVSGLDASGETPVDRQMVLRSPIAFSPQENGTIEFVLSDSASASDLEIDLELLGVTAEKMGRKVGTRS